MNILDTIQNIGLTVFEALGLLAIVVILGDIILGYVRSARDKVESVKITFLEVKLPPDNEFEIKNAEHMFSSLSAFKKPFLKDF